MVRRIAVVAAVVLLPMLAVPAQTSPYVGLRDRAIKALSADEIEGYLEGEGMGLALPAELNGWPGPRHVLDMAAALELTPAQTEAVQASFDRMHADAVRLGTEIVDRERALDAAFEAPAVDTGELRASLLRLGELRGELRFAHLRAHVETRAILSDAQVRRYAELRGYDGHPAVPGHRHLPHGHS